MGDDTYNHADGVLFAALAVLDRLVNHQVHEGVESAQHAHHETTAVQLQRQTLVHVSAQMINTMHGDSGYKFKSFAMEYSNTPEK